MVSAHLTPRALVDALQQRDVQARGQLDGLLRVRVRALVGELVARYAVATDRDRLTTHALHAVETWLRTQPAGSFDGMSWSAFSAGVLLHLAKQASQPFGKPSADSAPPHTVPQTAQYHSEALFLPHQRVGDFWFGGDWLGALEAADGSLWVLLADVTGHGYCAYLTASALPGVWRACWAATSPDQPADLLAAMHKLLQDCLPDGIFVECTLARLSREGGALVAPAGGSRLLLRRGKGQTDLVKLRGTWLGLRTPSVSDQRSWVLAEDDELMLGTDGVFDQLAVEGEGLDVERLARAAQPSLFAGLRRLLEQALQKVPQKDDITLVVLRRRPEVEVAASATRIKPEAGDV
jgi:hypothetical protein